MIMRTPVPTEREWSGEERPEAALTATPPQVADQSKSDATRMIRLQSLCAAIADGSYSVTAEQLADSLLHSAHRRTRLD